VQKKPGAAAAAEAASDTSTTPLVPAFTNPAYQFGGPTGSLAIPPFVAPSN